MLSIRNKIRSNNKIQEFREKRQTNKQSGKQNGRLEIHKTLNPKNKRNKSSLSLTASSSSHLEAFVCISLCTYTYICIHVHIIYTWEVWTSQTQNLQNALMKKQRNQKFSSCCNSYAVMHMCMYECMKWVSNKKSVIL
jgi:hypothetical protein